MLTSLLHSRLLSFNESTRELSVVATSACNSHCVLKCSSVIINDQSDSQDGLPSNSRVLLISAATNGVVTFWDITEFCSDCSETDVQASSNSADDSESDNVDLSAFSPNAHKKVGAINPCFDIQLHQSGINSLQLVQQGKYFLVRHSLSM